MQMLKVRIEQLSGNMRGFYNQTGEPLKCWDQDTIRFPEETEGCESFSKTLKML